MARIPKEAFFTRVKANAGIKVPLSMDGQETGEWLLILGKDSERYRLGERECFLHFKPRAEEADLQGKAAQEALLDDIKRRHDAYLVKAWSWDEPCTVDAVEAFFAGAEYIRAQVVEVASATANFREPTPPSSTQPPSTSSDSASPSPRPPEQPPTKPKETP